MFMHLVKSSISLVFDNLGAVFKVVSAWFLVQLAVALAFVVVLALFAGNPAGSPFLLTATAMSVVGALVGLVAASSIAVAWHRFGLLGEQPPAVNLRFGGLELRFALKSLVITIGFGVAYAIAGGIGMVTGSTVIMSVLVLAVAIVLIPIVFRVSLVLPATAVEETLGFKEAYEAGKGLGWWMVLATLALALPFAIATGILQFALGLLDGALPLVIVMAKAAAINLLMQMIMTVLALSVLTNGYKLAKEGDRSQPDVAGSAGAPA
ncbi:hypothetical protein [Labrenzia sp. VG12]|uniref:hypothetical protein n=1 Tax=Labrenzia sp. VG12 TaxID=2021862 RepID=UPI0012FD4311|nr:hypothetical protein [Labrenzia sp. VG12]